MVLCQRGRNRAECREEALDALVQARRLARLSDDEYARLYEAFGELGEDAEECDVEFAMAAQREALRADCAG